jgi:hypothetical protein
VVTFFLLRIVNPSRAHEFTPVFVGFALRQLGHTIFEEVISIFVSTSLRVQLLLYILSENSLQHFGYVIYEKFIAPY